MDARVAGAGIAMAIGMMVLLPTFNALNNSYVEGATPPEWMIPDEIPENFKPPDMKPPEGYVPPPDAKPPPGWEPPPDYSGPIPPGGCPPPVIVRHPDMNRTGTLDPQFSGIEWTFEIPKYTVGVAANVTFTNWRASTVRAILVPPEGDEIEDAENGNTGGLLVPATPRDKTEFSLQIIAEQDGSNMPPSGTYTLRLDADIPIDGSYTTQVGYAVACGGLLT